MTISRLHAPLVFLLALSLYVVTSAPGLTAEDSAELATGARFLTMVHAPGYPLYLLAGRLAALADTAPGRGLVLFSAFAAAMAVSLVYLALRTLWGEAPALVGAATLTVMQGFWDAAIIVEVYALQSALFAALLFALVSLRARPSGRTLRLLGLLLGLMLAHHVGVIILLPFLLGFLAWQTRPFPREALLPALGHAALGLLLYAALILLSARPGIPVLWWQPIHTLGELARVASGAGFRSLLFAVPLVEVVQNLVRYPLLLAGWVNILSLVLVLLGVVHLGRGDRPLLVLVGGIIAMTVFHAANYAVLDPESFLLPAAVPIAVLAGAGFRSLEDWRKGRPVYAEMVAATVVIVGIAGRLAMGQLMAASVQTLPLDIARTVLAAHDRDRGDTDILIWSDWHLYPTLRYVQIAEGAGRRVTVELDSTAGTPGISYWPGRTWTMRPTRTVGARHPLVMSDLHWMVMAPPDSAGGPSLTATRDTFLQPLLSLHGMDLVRADTPAGARFGEPIAVTVWLTRSASWSALLPDSPVTGALVLIRNGHPILKTPFAPLAWHATTPSWLPGRLYAEPVQTLIPTAFSRGPATDEYRLALELSGSGPVAAAGDTGALARSQGTGPPDTDDARIDLGPLPVQR